MLLSFYSLKRLAMLLGYTLAAENARCFCAFNCKSMSTGWGENCLICTNGGQGRTDLSRYLYVHELEVSTHASVQGATRVSDMVCFPSSFQPTPPAQGATGGGERGPAEAVHFNPRPPRRGRQQKQPKQNPRFPLNPAPPPNPHLPKHHPQDLPPRTPPISPGKPGAKPLRSPARFPFAPTISEHPPGRKSPWRRNARSCFRTGSPGNKSAGCLFPGP